MSTSKWKEFTVLRKDYGDWKSDSSLQIYLTLLKNQIFKAIDELLKEKLIEDYHFLTHRDKNGMNLSGRKPGGLDFYILPTDESQLSKICEILDNCEIPTDYEDNNGDHSDTENVLKLNTELIRKIINQSNSPSVLRKTYSDLIDCLVFLLSKERQLSNLQVIVKKYGVPASFTELIEKIVNISINQTKPCNPKLFKDEIIHFLNNSIGMSGPDEIAFLRAKGLLSS